MLFLKIFGMVKLGLQGSRGRGEKRGNAVGKARRTSINGETKLANKGEGHLEGAEIVSGVFAIFGRNRYICNRNEGRGKNLKERSMPTYALKRDRTIRTTKASLSRLSTGTREIKGPKKGKGKRRGHLKYFKEVVGGWGRAPRRTLKVEVWGIFARKKKTSTDQRSSQENRASCVGEGVFQKKRKGAA